jgi:hypothetical protein
MLKVIEQMASLNEECALIRRDVRRAFVARNERGIRRLQDQGLADPDLDAHTAASALASMIDNFAYVWFVLDEPFDEDVAAQTLTRLWLRAIGAPSPRSSPPRKWSESGHPPWCESRGFRGHADTSWLQSEPDAIFSATRR